MPLGTALMIAVVSTSCGKITEYETKAHECGRYNINTFEDIEKLFFEEHTPMEKLLQNRFKDFCYYKSDSTSKEIAYTAYVFL